MRSGTTSSPAAASTSIAVSHGVLALAAVMWAASYVMWVSASSHDTPLIDATLAGSVTIPWFVILVMVALAETFVVHLHFRLHSGSFSFVEVPMLLGLIFTPPSTYIPAVAAGGLIALVLFRKQSPLKILYNGANLAFRPALSWLLVDLLSDSQGLDLLSTSGWVVVGIAMMLTSVIELTLLSIVIALSEGSVRWRSLLSVFNFGTAVAWANVMLGLVTAILLIAAPSSTALIAVLVGGFGIGYRSYSAEQRQRERIEMLRTSSRQLAETTEQLEAGQLVASQAATMFGARLVELMLPSSGGQTAERGTVVFVNQDGDLDRHHGRRTMTSQEHGLTQALLKRAQDPILLKNGGELDEFRRLIGQDEAMVGSLSVGSSTGVLIVGDSLNDARQFGADDLQTLDALLQQAAMAIENGVLGSRIHELKGAEEQLSHEANHDSLTGLANRAKLNSLLDAAVEAGHQDLALLYVDLDDFKIINDTLGHAAGDAVLVEVGRRMNQTIRADDVAARFGGDEFAILIHDNPDPRPLAQRILAAVTAPFEFEGQPVAIGATIGLATWEAGLSSRMLVGRADVAMYSAKRSGKGTVASYLDEMAVRVDAQQRMRAQLRQAVDEDEFTVLYQPIYSLRDQQIVGAEALVRWRSPDGLLLPEGFLFEADRSGIIQAIDQIVMAEVIDHLAALSSAAKHNIWLSVNVSQWSLHDKELVPSVVQLLDSAAVDPKHLMMEFTESTVSHDPEFAIGQLTRLRQVGIQLAMDDFGAGQSSIRSLRRFPFETVKITGQAVLEGDLNDPTLLRAMVDTAHTFGLSVVAEGVEDQTVMHQLVALGCEAGQGYLFDRPMEFDTLMSKIKAAVPLS